MPLTDTDRLLLQQCLGRVPGAWESFVDRYIGVFIHVIRQTAHAHSMELSRDDVEDLCGEIFVTLLSNNFAVLRHFRGQSALATYLTVVARRIAVHGLTHRRKAEAFGHVAASSSALQTVGVESHGAQQLLDREEARELLNHLPASEAAVVKAYHLDGKSYREISQELGIAENSIGPTLARARERMRHVKLASK
jgi:RNA polymerase sigma-70 factor (ECF subfamily)